MEIVFYVYIQHGEYWLRSKYGCASKETAIGLCGDMEKTYKSRGVVAGFPENENPPAHYPLSHFA